LKPSDDNISPISDTDKITVLREVTSTRPIIRLIETKDGIQTIVKDFSQNGLIFRNIVGRFLIWREVKAYRQLSNLTGVPRLLGVFEGPALEVEAINGVDLKLAGTQKQLPPGFFDTLNDLVDKVHECGVAHCDMKASGNIIVDSNGYPSIIDWGASISKTEFRFFPLNKIYNRFVVDDYRAITKFKLRYMPDSVSTEEKEQ